jgi:Stress responsive A/B Barrel Domain
MSKQLEYFVHHVYFWLKKPVTRESRLKFENGLKKLVTIETIIGKHLGTPAPTDRGVIDSTYSYSLLLTFKNKEDQDIYQTHPTHLKFIDECEELWERVLVYDSVKIT